MVVGKVIVLLITVTLFGGLSTATNNDANDKADDYNVVEDVSLTTTPAEKKNSPASKEIDNSGGRKVTEKARYKDQNGESEEGMQNPQKPTAVTGEKRAATAVAAAAASDAIQEAVIDKGIEVAGKLVDKQLQIIDEAQEKAEQFLKKEIKLDIVPDKSWATKDLYVPPGYHFQSSITDGAISSSRETPDVPFVYPAGVGSMMMNGCYGRNYSKSDPCYNLRAESTICLNQIDGASFMGVGFDYRGKYSPESRKMSIVQRNCVNKATYDNFDVPDTMNVHGIYDTSASMYTFQGQEEYTSFLQQEAGVSGSSFGFYAGVKEAWGSSSAETKNSFLAVLDVDIERYEIFLDEVKPSDLSLSFLKEFMELPLSYYSPGAPIKYQDFVQRWGTHYIKSAKFGGQLEIRKTMDKSIAQTKTHFSVMMEAEFKSLFASVGARSSLENGDSGNNATATTSTSMVVQGGSHEIASILSDAYSPTFKNEFKEWLESIPSYPKPFKFQMSPIADLLNFRATDLFPDEDVNWGCEGYVTALKTERNEDGEEVKYYEVTEGDQLKKKIYCSYDSRGGLEEAIKRKRSSLHRAIEVYMEEGTISTSDFNLQCPDPVPTKPPALPDDNQVRLDDLLSVRNVPKWKTLTSSKRPFKVIVDMKEDVKDAVNGDVLIPKHMVRRIRFLYNHWFTDDEKDILHLYNGFNNGGSGNPKNKKISVLGLVVSFEEKTGRLVLSNTDYEASKKLFPALSSRMKGSIIGMVKLDSGKAAKHHSKSADSPPPSIETCKVVFSNALRFDPRGGQCLHFTAISAGTMYVMFAVSPGKRYSWYTVRIASDRVDIFKGDTSKRNTTEENAVGLGEASIHQSFFVCVTESLDAVLIEYGKSQGSSDDGEVVLSFTDGTKINSAGEQVSKPLRVRFYAFGIEDLPAKIMDAHLLSRGLTKVTCKGKTYLDLPTSLCTDQCHGTCDPLAGCSGPADTDCVACRLAKDTVSGRCLEHCIDDTFLTSEEVCRDTFEISAKTITEASVNFNLGTMPLISAFTASLWVKTSAGTEPTSEQEYALLHFASLSLELFIIFKVKSTGNTFIELEFLYKPQLGFNFAEFGVEELDYAENPQWHFICVTWSGLNGVVTLYVDGSQKGAEHVSKREHQSFSGGGNLAFLVYGGAPIHLTSFNMWDHILSPDVIGANAQTCDSDSGNVKEWYDLWRVEESRRNLFVKPSTCQSNRRPTASAVASENQGDFYRKPLNLAKNKKRKSLDKSGGKTRTRKRVID